MSKNLYADLRRYLPAQIVPGVVGFIATPIVTRLFAPEVYALYSLALATALVCTLLLAWQPMATIRFYPAYETRGESGLFQSVTVRLLLISMLAAAVLMALVLLVARARLSSPFVSLLWVTVPLVVCRLAFAVMQHLLRITRQVGLYSIFAVWHSAGGLALGLVLILALGVGIEGLLWGATASLLVILPFLWRKAVPARAPIPEGSVGPLTRNMMSYAFPLVATNLCAWALRLSDRYILQGFRGSAEVGIYSASYNIADNTITLLSVLIMSAGGPLLMQTWEREGERASAALLTTITRFFLLLCIPAAVGMSVLSKPLVEVMTGEAYHEGHRIMVYIVTGAFLLGLQQRYQAPFLFRRQTLVLTATVVAAALLNIGLNLCFVPLYGYIAAAVTTLISYAFLAALTIGLSLRRLVWRFPLMSLVRAGGSSAVMALCLCILLKLMGGPPLVRLLVCTTVGVLVYGAMLCASRELSERERKSLWAAIKRDGMR